MEVKFNNESGVALPEGFEADALAAARDYFGKVKGDTKAAVASLVKGAGATMVKDDSANYPYPYPADGACLLAEVQFRGSDEWNTYLEPIYVPGYRFVDG